MIAILSENVDDAVLIILLALCQTDNNKIVKDNDPALNQCMVLRMPKVIISIKNVLIKLSIYYCWPYTKLKEMTEVFVDR